MEHYNNIKDSLFVVSKLKDEEVQIPHHNSIIFTKEKQEDPIVIVDEKSVISMSILLEIHTELIIDPYIPLMKYLEEYLFRNFGKIRGRIFF